MRTKTLFLITTLLAATSGFGQNGENTGKSNNIGFGISVPIGDFSDTHSFGLGLNYSWSNHRYGKMTARPADPIGFTFNAGVDYYFGKKETVNMYTYDYPGYTYIHAYGGIMHNPCTNGFLELTAGPVLGLWDGNSEFGFGVNLGGSFGICRSMGINPFFTLMKHSDSDPIYTFGTRIHYSF
ncbi:MAG TPA: hypothetical protein VEB63_09095 [Chitinophagaceae bacterium]|nr:hypothetical protein [Chitinophagaceae bacterium]